MSLMRDDPYVSLEDVESESSLHFAIQANQACLKSLGDPTKSKSLSYKRILGVLETDDRIPFVSKMGRDSKGNDLLYNLWKDSKVGY
jgi:prolyl oligopeptidase PreP (S9A serine peptidase family)